MTVFLDLKFDFLIARKNVIPYEFLSFTNLAPKELKINMIRASNYAFPKKQNQKCRL